MHACECRANSQHRHASDDIGLHGAHGRVRLAETGVGTRGTNPHPKHALERRQYPLCGREILSVSPPTDYTRQQRSAYGHTHADRPSASKNADDCQASLKRLAERQRGSRAAPFARRPPVRACVRDIRRGHESASGSSTPTTPGRREPDAARWTQRAGSHPCRGMCGMALRGACAPDIRRATEFTHWPRLAAAFAFETF